MALIALGFRGEPFHDPLHEQPAAVRAARSGSFTSRAHHEPGASALGHTQPTIDHFVTDRPETDQPRD